MCSILVGSESIRRILENCSSVLDPTRLYSLLGTFITLGLLLVNHSPGSISVALWTFIVISIILFLIITLKWYKHIANTGLSNLSLHEYRGTIDILFFFILMVIITIFTINCQYMQYYLLTPQFMNININSYMILILFFITLHRHFSEQEYQFTQVKYI